MADVIFDLFGGPRPSAPIEIGEFSSTGVKLNHHERLLQNTGVKQGRL
jgi:hypothetical protein